MASSYAEVLQEKAVMGRRAQWLPLVQQAAAAQGIPWEMLDAIILNESRYNPGAKGPTNDLGISQFIPGTARQYGLKVGNGVDERTDPVKSIHASARLLKDLYKQAKGDWGKVGVGYNAGSGAMNAKSLTAGPAKYKRYMESAQRFTNGAAPLAGVAAGAMPLVAMPELNMPEAQPVAAVTPPPAVQQFENPLLPATQTAMPTYNAAAQLGLDPAGFAGYNPEKPLLPGYKLTT